VRNEQIHLTDNGRVTATHYGPIVGWIRGSMAGKPARSVSISQPDLTDRERACLLEAFDSSWVSSIGPFVNRFEERFAEFVGVANAMSCVNGTAALHLALLGLNVGPGDEVIVPDMTYVATVNAVRYIGATPVLADCDPMTWVLNPESVARLITKRTRAVIAVHLLGMPCDLGALGSLCKRHNLYLIEDASEAHGALYNGRPIGSWGDVATFSFYGNKILTTGEGGMVCTDDSGIAARIRKLRGQGSDPKRPYWFDQVGYNYRMTNLACSLGLAQLERFEQLRRKREDVRNWYESALRRAKLPVRTQQATPSSRPVLWMFGIVLDDAMPITRDALAAALARARIETRPFFHPLHTLPMYIDEKADNKCPVSVTLGQRGLMLPTHTKLTESEVRLIVETIEAAIQKLAVVA
jgi:perosamine synthetase